MKTKKAFSLAAARAEQFLALDGIRFAAPEQAYLLALNYAGHAPWGLADFRKAAAELRKYLEAHNFRISHTRALELVARLEGLKSWHALMRHVVYGEVLEPGAGEQQTGDLARAHQLGDLRVRADRAVLNALPDQPELAQLLAIRVKEVHQALRQFGLEKESLIACVKVEYDPNFFGGDYDEVGDFAAVPHSLIELASGSVEDAFCALTGLAAANIVHYTVDEVVDQDGVEFGDAAPENGGSQGQPVAAGEPRPVLWIRKDRPMSQAELEAHTDRNARYIDVVVDVSWDLLGDIDNLNDEVSERITGSSVALTDIGYVNHFPSDKERQQLGEPDPRSVWIRVTAAWEPDTEFG